MNLKPLRDLVIVKRSEAESTSEGGIHLPNVEGRASIFADVIAAGPQSELVAGNRVVLHGWQGTAVRFEGEELLALRERDIYAAIE